MPVLISRGGGGGANSYKGRECIFFILILVSGPIGCWVNIEML